MTSQSTSFQPGNGSRRNDTGDAVYEHYGSPPKIGTAAGVSSQELPRMTRPEGQLRVREEIYLGSALDLF